MPSQQIPAAPVVGGVTSRRHAKLLHHLFENNGGGASANAPVKDLRIRRVVPPASAPPPDSSPDCSAAAKPVSAVQIQAQSTPPEPSVAAASEDRERKPILPRSKLVRDPASFGYRRLLPFLNQMAAKNGSDISDGKGTPSETKVPISTNKELSRSDSGLVAGESVDASQGGAAAVVDPVEPLAAEAAGDREAKDCSDDTVREEAKISVSADPASSKPCVTRCARSKFVHHPSSFSYKRMLPFLMENEISSQEEDRAKIRRVSEEEPITPDAGNVLATSHLAVSKGSSEECNGTEVDRVVEEVPSISAEVQEVTPGEVLASVGDPLSSEKGGFTSDRNAVLANGQHEPVVSEESPKERDVAEAETTIEEREASQSDEKSVSVDSVEPLVAKAGGDQEMKDPCDSVKEQTMIVPGDLASSKPCIARCPRSRLVHQRNSFSYKRMLPFLMGNEISSQEGDMAKLQRVPAEKQLAPEESPVMASVHHDPSISVDSAEASYKAEVERIVEEIASAPLENYLLTSGQLQYAVTEVSLDSRTAEVQKATPEVVLSSHKDELASDGDAVLAGAQCQLVSEVLTNESNVAEAEGIVVEENTGKSDENSVDLQSAVSEVSSQEGDAEKDATQKPVLTSDGDRPQLLGSKELLQGNAEIAEVQECQSSESGCPDRVTVDGGADKQGAQETQGFVASPDTLLLDVGMICMPSDPCLEKQCLSPKKLSPVNGALSGVSCLKKRFLSPKKGILKRHTNGCKGICMCLDCSVFRLRADRAFEFSRKQMQEADDIIENLLEEVMSLRSLAEKSSGRQGQIEEACRRASRVEEVARERRRQMQVELNSHCKIPGPRVKFAQYVEEKMSASSPHGGNIRR